MKISHHLAAVCLAVATFTASASVTYTYVGNPLRDENQPGSDYVESGIHATLTLSDDGSQLLGWSMGQSSLGELTSWGSDSYVRFSLTTDSLGRPTLWNLNAQAQQGDLYLTFWTVINHPWSLPATFDFGAQYPTVQYGNTYAQGTWSFTAALPNLNAQFTADPAAVPEPGTMPMFGGGLAALAMLARRRTRS